ncbi:hypothetical protein PG995_008771 [Apiospora arundinis]
MLKFLELDVFARSPSLEEAALPTVFTLNILSGTRVDRRDRGCTVAIADIGICRIEIGFGVVLVIVANVQEFAVTPAAAGVDLGTVNSGGVAVECSARLLVTIDSGLAGVRVAATAPELRITWRILCGGEHAAIVVK